MFLLKTLEEDREPRLESGANADGQQGGEGHCLATSMGRNIKGFQRQDR